MSLDRVEKIKESILELSPSETGELTGEMDVLITRRVMGLVSPNTRLIGLVALMTRDRKIARKFVKAADVELKIDGDLDSKQEIDALAQLRQGVSMLQGRKLLRAIEDEYR